jgi:hypothetical protein
MVRTKKNLPKGLTALIQALRGSHKGAKDLDDKLETLNRNQEVPDENITQLGNWERDAKADNLRKISRQIARLIHEYGLEQND